MQIFHITEIKHNIIEFSIFVKYITILNTLNNKLHIKDKYTKLDNI